MQPRNVHTRCLRHLLNDLWLLVPPAAAQPWRLTRLQRDVVAGCAAALPSSSSAAAAAAASTALDGGGGVAPCGRSLFASHWQHGEVGEEVGAGKGGQGPVCGGEGCLRSKKIDFSEKVSRK